MEALKEFGIFLLLVLVGKALEARVNPYTLRFLKCLDCGSRVGKEAAQAARNRHERRVMLIQKARSLSARRHGRPRPIRIHSRPLSYPVTCFICGAENDFLPGEGKWRNQPEKEPVIWSAISRWLKRRRGETADSSPSIRRA